MISDLFPNGPRAHVASLLASRRVRIVLLFLGAVLLLGLTARYCRKALTGNDFGAYYAAGCAVLEGTDIYEALSPEGRDYLYPPPLAILIAPLTILPVQVIAVLWVLLTLVSMGASLFLCLKLVEARGSEAWQIGLLTLICVARPLDSELGNGQANHLVVFCVVLFAWLFTRGRKASSGLALAGAIALKVTPVLLCGYLLYKREWSTLCWSIVGVLALVLVLPSLCWGPGRAVQANVRWAAIMVDPYATSAGEAPERPPAVEVPPREPGHAAGYSLRSMTLRYLTWTEASFHTLEPVFVNVADLPFRTAERIYNVIALLLLLAVAVACTPGRLKLRGRFLLELSLCLTTMLLISPISRKAHFVALLLPFAVCATFLVRGQARRVLWFLVPAVVCLNLSSRAILGKVGSVYVLAYGVFFLGALLLWAGLLVRTTRGESVPFPTEEDVGPDSGDRNPEPSYPRRHSGVS